MQQAMPADRRAESPAWDVLFLLLPDSLMLDWAGPSPDNAWRWKVLHPVPHQPGLWAGGSGTGRANHGGGFAARAAGSGAVSLFGASGPFASGTAPGARRRWARTGKRMAQIRLAVAQQALRSGRNVTQAAEMAGFSSDTQLRRAWHQFGAAGTPSQAVL